MAKAPRPPKNLKERAHAVASSSRKGWQKSAGKVPDSIKGPAFLSGPSIDAMGRSYRRWHTKGDDPKGKERGSQQDSHGKSKHAAAAGGGKEGKETLQITPYNATQFVNSLAANMSALSKHVDTLQNKINDMHARQNPFGTTTKDAQFDILHHQYKDATNTYNPLATKDAIPFAKNSCAATLHESEQELHESDGACGVKHSGNNLDSPVKEFKVFGNNQLHAKLANGKEGIFTPEDIEGSVGKMQLSKAISKAMGVATPELRQGQYGINGKKHDGAMEERVNNAMSATPDAAKAMIGDDGFNNAAVFDLLTGQKRKDTDVLIRKTESKYPYEAVLTNNKDGFSKDGHSAFVEGNNHVFSGDNHAALEALTDKALDTIGKSVGANPKHISEIKRRRDIIKKGIKEGNTIHQMQGEINGTPVHSRGKWREVPGQHTTSKAYKVANGKENIEFSSKSTFDSFISQFGHDGLTNASDILSQFPDGNHKKFIEKGVSEGTYAFRSEGEQVPGKIQVGKQQTNGKVRSHTFEGILDANNRENMEISFAKVAKEKQGTDVMKNFFKGAEKHMRDLGVKKISLNANIDVGAYAWAKYGFDFKDAGTQAEFVNDFKSFAGKKGFNVQNELFSSSWDIARATSNGEKIGKEFMLNRTWDGELDLNPESKGYKQFKAYVHGDAPAVSTKATKEKAILTSTKDTKGLREEKNAISANGYKPEEVAAFVQKHYKKENYSALANKDNVYLVQPTTSGKNTIPKNLAKQLQSDFGGTVVEDFAIPLAKTESKHKGFIGKIREPQQYEMTKDLSQYKGKHIVSVDDVMNTGESQLALNHALQSQGLSINKTATIGASELNNASPRDFERMSEKLSKHLGVEKDATHEMVKKVFGGVNKQFANMAEKVIDRTPKDAKEVYDYIKTQHSKMESGTATSSKEKDEKFINTEPTNIKVNPSGRGGSNENSAATTSFMADVGDEKAIIKPDSYGVISDHKPSTREEAAYNIGQALGLNVPLVTTKSVEINGVKEHSTVARFVPDLKSGQVMRLDGTVKSRLAQIPEHELAKAAVMDDITANIDRNENNWGITPDNKLHLIDHGNMIWKHGMEEKDTVNGIRTFAIPSDSNMMAAIIGDVQGNPSYRYGESYKKAMDETYGKRGEISKALQKSGITGEDHDNVMDRLEYFHRYFVRGEFAPPTLSSQKPYKSKK